MKDLFVKICGITRPEDADLAAELGAGALGFVFWPGSPRCVAPDVARGIIRRSGPRVTSVGVFVDASPEEVTRIMDEVGLDVAQLHGHESPEYCRQLAKSLEKGDENLFRGDPEKKIPVPFFARLIKAIGLQDSEPVVLGEFDADVLILVDAHDPSRYGGTGRTVDWAAARQVASMRKTILAGGLNPENITRAIDAVQPYGVDVSSGVESEPGVKDAARLRRFFEELQ